MMETLRLVGLVALVLATSCSTLVPKDDGFPERLKRDCFGDQDCWEMKKQTVFHLDACAAGKLPDDECARLAAALEDRRQAAARKAAEPPEWEVSQKKLAAQRQAETADLIARKRAEEDAAWRKLDLPKCREAELDACQDVRDFIHAYPESLHAPDAQAALAVADPILGARYRSESAELSGLRGRVDADNEARRGGGRRTRRN